MSSPFWTSPIKYLRWAAHERPNVFYSLLIGAMGPITLLTVPPIRKSLGYTRAEPVPLSYPFAPQAQRAHAHHQAHHMMHNYSHSPLARSTTDLSEFSEVTHEYEPDVDADGFRHPGNHHAEDPGDYSPGSTLRPLSNHGSRPASKMSKFKPSRPSINEETKPASFTFEHEPDVDGDGLRHHHENLASPALRALQDVVVPLDPRAGRIVITPSPSLKPNYSPYKHNDDIPNRSIEDLQDPEELHSHANMIYGIDEARASQFSVPDWQEGEAMNYIEEASHGDLKPPTVPKRPVATKLPIEPTGEVMAPVGNIAGDTKPVGPTRNMTESEMPGIDGAYTKDGEGSAGLPFDANSGASKKEGDISVQDESSAVPQDMMASTETLKARRMSSIATDITQPERPRAATPGPVEDVRLPQEKALSQDGSAMVVEGDDKDERPEWLRAAEMMGNSTRHIYVTLADMLANNEYDKLMKEHLVTNERASNESIDFASAARATLLRDHKIERGSSYPSFAEMESAGASNDHGSTAGSGKSTTSRQGVSDLPEKDLGGANPPSGSQARADKFSVETETPSFKAKDNVEPATAAKFLGLSAGAAMGASVPAAALMTSERDAKSHTTGENRLTEQIATSGHTPQDNAQNAANHLPTVPKNRPQKRVTTDDEKPTPKPEDKSPDVSTKSPMNEEPQATKSETKPDKAAPEVPRRPASSTAQRDLPTIPARPSRASTASKDAALKAPMPTKPAVPARPAVGKLAGSSKFAFASALEAKLRGGPPAPKKKEEPEEKEIVPEEPAKPLADTRKGRARGPQKRKPAASSVATNEEDSAEKKNLDELLSSPVCEKGEFFVSRFGVEMRSMSIQTGVIKISSPAGNVTVMEGAGTEYPGQTVVVDTPNAKPHAISKEETELEAHLNSAGTTEKVGKNESSGGVVSSEAKGEAQVHSEQPGGLRVPDSSVESAAGGELRSLEKNNMKPMSEEEEEPDQSVQNIRDELEVEL
ncbi:protein of unknown function [Taphrina deformans PYCC 5710]|uniref:Uncharacterized protein n=1 Tax=Taphrina deformans (strain PYCC 5710 / ATCC 11124 / CBS 356.35 / IMI 108563 / JCM 9778 / NBRC 8474) TaxID=1097556 RepID=R4XEL0_TAPDE|nr:protein of unknown function [Taphrina deformans PYCC 5710]|eukprot:CCG84092.1 protein of unknown function [Taphrina deformans PYCC 5710]